MAALLGRRATAEDMPALLSLLADDVLGCEREDIGPPANMRYAEAFEAIDHDPNQLLAVFEQEGGIVGCMQISFIPGLSRVGTWRGQIESVRIAAHGRGDGLGREMIAWGIKACRERGCGLVQLTSDKSRGDALRLYRALGFEASHEGFKLALT